MSAARSKKPKVKVSSAPPQPVSLGNGKWQCASWTRADVVFEQDLNERTCSCEAGKKGLWCKHLTCALMLSMSLQLQRARQADAKVVRALLTKGVHQGRPDIEMALVAAAYGAAMEAWQKLQAAAPGEEPEPPSGGPALPNPLSLKGRYEAIGRKLAA